MISTVVALSIPAFLFCSIHTGKKKGRRLAA